MVGSNAWAKAQAYLRGKCNSKCKCKSNSHSKSKSKSKNQSQSQSQCQCGDLSTAAAKSAAFGRDDSVWGDVDEEREEAGSSPSASLGVRMTIQKRRSDELELGSGTEAGQEGFDWLDVDEVLGGEPGATELDYAVVDLVEFVSGVGVGVDNEFAA